MKWKFKAGLLWLALMPAILAYGQPPSSFMRGQDRQNPSQFTPSDLQEIGIDQHLDEQIPLDLQFKDETGNTVQLAQFFHPGRPVILNLVYYQCPMLCGEVMNGLVSAMGVMKFTAGKEFEVVTVSIDPRETPDLALAKKKTYMERYNRPGAENGWHFLTGDQHNIDVLAKTMGFKYRYDAKLNQFIHAAGIALVTPQGKMAQYYYGVEYSPKDLRLGLIEASQDKIGNIVDQVVLYCYHYDPNTGKYGAVISNILRIGGALTMVMLGGFIVLMLRRDHEPHKTGQA